MKGKSTSRAETTADDQRSADRQEHDALLGPAADAASMAIRASSRDYSRVFRTTRSPRRESPLRVKAQARSPSYAPQDARGESCFDSPSGSPPSRLGSITRQSSSSLSLLAAGGGERSALTHASSLSLSTSPSVAPLPWRLALEGLELVGFQAVARVAHAQGHATVHRVHVRDFGLHALAAGDLSRGRDLADRDECLRCPRRCGRRRRTP